MKQFFIFSYILFLILLTIFSYLFIDPGLFYLRFLFTNFSGLHRSIVSIGFLVSIFLFFGFYSWILYVIKRGEFSQKNLFQLVFISSLILVFAYPAMLSFDIFNYIATAKVTFFYHENPYLLMPIEFTRDPLLLFMHAANKTALYAPFWILLTGIPFLFGFGNFLLTLFTFKVFVGVFYFGTVFVLWKMTKNLFKTAWFALNPLVLIETFISGHNDIVMMFFLLLSIKLLVAKKQSWGATALLLSAGIKYVTIIFTPLYFIKNLSKEKFFLYTTIGMYIIFFLSSLREEIYPWYGLWFLLPTTFLLGSNALTWTTTALSFGLILRYIPFMLLGTYFGPTPLLKIVLMTIPVVVTTLIYFLTQKGRRLV